MDIAQFRNDFPEFSDIARYPDSEIALWSTFAEVMVVKCRWGTMWQMGVNLYIAHEIVMATQNAKSGAIGGVPGQQSGPINTKTVGSVSVGYDTQAGSEKDAGWWNLTSYGKQFYRLSRIFGAGVIQL